MTMMRKGILEVSVRKMADVPSGDMQSGIQLQGSSSYINGNCVNFMLMNEKYQEASVELNLSD